MRSHLVLTVKKNEVIQVGDSLIFVEKTENGNMRLHIEAPKEVKISRTAISIDFKNKLWNKKNKA